VLVVRDPRLPWRAASAEREKRQLVHDLCARFPGCAVWLDGRHDGLARGAQAAGPRLTGLAGNDWCGWFRADEALVQTLVRSPEGGWACAFFAAPSEQPLAPISPLPDAPDTVARLREDLGAEVVIVADLDDAFWLLSANASGSDGDG